MEKVLVTGGAGFIGSHTVVELDRAGYDVVIADNFSNSKPEVLNRLRRICGHDFNCRNVDCCDAAEYRKVFREEKIESVIHFAGFKAVGESVALPVKYYKNNLESLLNTVMLMREFGTEKLVFSSSATVYGESTAVPFTEESPSGKCTNPYGWTKWMIEQILSDTAKADDNFSVAILRYFNPVGAHESGLMGEDPRGIPNNLFPYISMVASGKLPQLTVFGNDYNTPDGTCIRDYIHVCDLAYGHVKALEYLAAKKPSEIVINLGTGKGTSVLEAVHAYEKACGHSVPIKIGERRRGDIPICYASTEKAASVLGFSAERGIDEMCRDAWKWQSENPDGYSD